MSEQKLNIEEIRKIILDKIDAMHISIDATVRLCEIHREMLQAIMERPDCMDIYSSEKVIEINTAKRSLAEIIKNLNELKSDIHIDNVEFVVSREPQNRFSELHDKSEAVGKIAEARRAEIPKYKPPLWMFILAPYTVIRHYIKGAIHKIRMKKYKEEGR